MTQKKLATNHLSPTEAKWFAIYSRYKCEKMVHQNLQRKDVSSYLPLKKYRRVYGKQKKWVEKPLISNYVFVKITSKEYIKVLETNHVLSFVKIAKDLISIPQFEIDMLKKVAGGMNVEIVNQKFAKGDWVEITSGQLAGTRAELLKVQGKNKILVKLEVIGLTIQIENPEIQVRKISNAPNR